MNNYNNIIVGSINNILNGVETITSDDVDQIIDDNIKEFWNDEQYIIDQAIRNLNTNNLTGVITKINNPKYAKNATKQIILALHNKLIQQNVLHEPYENNNKARKDKMSNVLTIAIDKITGDVTCGLSGLGTKFPNPTRRSDINEILDNRINDLIKEQRELLEDDTWTQFCNYPLNNCGEFCAINNALQCNLDINNLYIYSINIKSRDNYLQQWDSCENCQQLYKVYGLIFVDWNGPYNYE